MARNGPLLWFVSLTAVLFLAGCYEPACSTTAAWHEPGAWAAVGEGSPAPGGLPVDLAAVGYDWTARVTELRWNSGEAPWFDWGGSHNRSFSGFEIRLVSMEDKGRNGSAGDPSQSRVYGVQYRGHLPSNAAVASEALVEWFLSTLDLTPLESTGPDGLDRTWVEVDTRWGVEMHTAAVGPATLDVFMQDTGPWTPEPLGQSRALLLAGRWSLHADAPTVTVTNEDLSFIVAGTDHVMAEIDSQGWLGRNQVIAKIEEDYPPRLPGPSLDAFDALHILKDSCLH